jgi:arabinofuranosyltransferase
MTRFLRAERWSRHGYWLLAGLAAGIVIAVFLVVSSRLRGPGFPLDDAWIHETYARNLARGLGWVFQRGQPSGGSTSPLWTLLLVPGRVVMLPPVVWVSILGVASMAAAAVVTSKWLAAGFGASAGFARWAGLALVLEWHLVWAALSGMETLLAALLPLVYFGLAADGGRRPLALGMVVGFGIWIRPDLLSLTVAVVWLWWFSFRKSGRALRWLLTFGAGLAIAAVPYLLLQEALAGRPWPSTFYAKQAEYAALRQLPLATRFLGQLTAPLIGGLVLLVPGVVLWVVDVLRRRAWPSLAPFVWVLTYAAAFALRLPVSYQHGRYSMPMIPVLFVLGVVGLREGLRATSDQRWAWVLSRAWAASTLLVALAFLGIGARAYAQDVAIIETEMVQTANWLSENTATSALIAAHDIGAIGYYANRRIVDLAGLVSPEVIPVLRDEAALKVVLDDSDADYLVTFPSWYPQLTRGHKVVYRTDAPYAPEAGGDNMAVYQWGN